MSRNHLTPEERELLRELEEEEIRRDHPEFLAWTQRLQQEKAGRQPRSETKERTVAERLDFWNPMADRGTSLRRVCRWACGGCYVHSQTARRLVGEA